MNLRGVLSNWELFAHSPEAVSRLRELILQLAVQGKLVPQDPKDEPASVLLKKIKAEKERLVKDGKIKRDKPLAEIEEEEKPFELPACWVWVRFGDASINRDGERIPVSSSERDNRDKTYDYYGASGVIDKIDGYLFDKTLLLIGEDGANLINRSTPIAFLAHGKYWVNNHAHVIDTTHPELMTYLALFINAISLEPFVTGTAQPKMNQAKLNSIVIALPPLAEQSRIVTRVQELMQLCDALEAKVTLEAQQNETLLRTLLATLTQNASSEDLAQNWQRVSKHFPLLLDRVDAIDALEQTILQLAVRGLLVPQNPSDEPASQLLKKIRAEKDKLIQEGKIKRDKPLPPIAEDEQPFELPKGWEWVRLGDISEFTNGFAFPSSEFTSDKTGVGVVKIGDLQNGEVVAESMSYVSQQYALGIDKSFQVFYGDMLIAMSGATTGKLGFNRLQQTFLLNQRVGKITLYFVHQDFANQYLVTKIAENLAISAGSAIPNLSTAQIKEIAFPLPPLPEQHRIVTRVTELRQLCAALRSRLAQSSQIQAQLAQALVQSSHD
jgi:type I restriction enzyme, S subunit